MADKKPTENQTRSSTEHLDRVDRLIAEQRGKSFDDPEEITSRTQVEEIARHAAEDAVRGRITPPTPVQVVIAERPSSTPPSLKKRDAMFKAIGGLLGGIAAVLVALSQCSHDVHEARGVKVHETKP